ncbi:MAG: S1/P1 nuclease [Pyrinomonadaceae bacterium]|nr:S1/P1 nuclease [Pyrinomonadaceae bacterium]
MQNVLGKYIFLILIFSAFSVTCPAWDEVGHKLTSIIAWERMTPEAREKAFMLLNSAPEDSDLNVHYNRFNSRSEAIKRLELFMFAATWSDVVRDRSFDVRNKNYNQGDWHYADIFWKQENGKAKILEDFPEESGKAIPKLYDFEKILRDPSYKDDEKAIAIAWFLHVGGDIHNPVHNASRITENSPKGDQGGNRFTFIPRTETQRGLNLHGYWDSIIGRRKPRKNDACDTDYLIPIARKIIKKFPYSKMRSRLKLGDYKKWNMEGFKLLNEVVYTPEISRNEMPSKKYRKRADRTAREQIALAGYRLGETLNRIFAEKPIGESMGSPNNCLIIRKVLYPVSKRPTPDQEMRIALIDICPPNRGMVTRPTTPITVFGESAMFEYDVVRVFTTKKEAEEFAKKNKIKDSRYQ